MIWFIPVVSRRTDYKVAEAVILTLLKLLMCLLSGDTETERHISLLIFLINEPRFLRSATAHTKRKYFTRWGSWKQQNVWHEVNKPSSIKSGLQTSVPISHVYQLNMSSVYVDDVSQPACHISGGNVEEKTLLHYWKFFQSLEPTLVIGVHRRK
jgi:hypothetical protein